MKYLREGLRDLSPHMNLQADAESTHFISGLTGITSISKLHGIFAATAAILALTIGVAVRHNRNHQLPSMFHAIAGAVPAPVSPLSATDPDEVVEVVKIVAVPKIRVRARHSKRNPQRQPVRRFQPPPASPPITLAVMGALEPPEMVLLNIEPEPCLLSESFIPEVPKFRSKINNFVRILSAIVRPFKHHHSAAPTVLGS